MAFLFFRHGQWARFEPWIVTTIERNTEQVLNLYFLSLSLSLSTFSNSQITGPQFTAITEEFQPISLSCFRAIIFN